MINAMQALAEEGNGTRLVEVQAQVMDYDESVGGWIPMAGGGMSAVTLEQTVKQPKPSAQAISGLPATASTLTAESLPLSTSRELLALAPLELEETVVTLIPQPSEAVVTEPLTQDPLVAKSEAPSTSQPSTNSLNCHYVLRAIRLGDGKVLMKCTVSKDITYRLMSPYLHTCTMGAKRFGLCFKSSYEACLFQKQLQKAIEHLYSQSKSSSGESNGADNEDLDDDVFVPVNLPVCRESSDSSGEICAGSSGRTQPLIAGSSSRSRVPLLQVGPKVPLLAPSTAEPSVSFEASAKAAVGPTTTYPYVYFSKDPTQDLLAYDTGDVSSRSYGSTSLSKHCLIKPSSSYGDRGGDASSGHVTGSGEYSSSGGSSRMQQQQQPYQSRYRPMSSSSGSYFQYSTRPSSRQTSYSLRREPLSIAGQPADPSTSVSFSASGSALLSSDVYGGQASSGAAGISSGAFEKRESVGSLKLPAYVMMHHPTGTELHRASKKHGGSGKELNIIERAQCLYCKQWFRLDQNRRGACPDAPDQCERWLHRLSCLYCANCALYCCCLQDDDAGEPPSHRGAAQICSCNPAESRCCLRWTILSLLSFFIPCLCLYPLCKGCHNVCCHSYAICGGRHKAVRTE